MMEEMKKFANEVHELTTNIIKLAKREGYTGEHLYSSIRSLYIYMEEKKND